MGGRGHWWCRRPHNKQIYMPQNADFLQKMPKAAELISAGAVDL